MTIEELANYLDVTHELDEAETKKLEGILSRAESVLQSTAGTDALEWNGSEQQLLLDCCRYIRCNAFEDFKVNFAPELFMLRAKYCTQTESEADDGS